MQPSGQPKAGPFIRYSDSVTAVVEKSTTMNQSTPEPLPAYNPAAYWSERSHFLKSIRGRPELRQRYLRAMTAYMLRRALWSFGFFPVFLAFWVPLVLASFNPVVMIQNLMPSLEAFLAANPEVQATTISTLFIAWFSVGFFFLVFDFVLTPFHSPFQYQADVHMRAWELAQRDPSTLENRRPDDRQDAGS